MVRLKHKRDLFDHKPGEIHLMRLLQEGDTIRDTYEVERFLGEGAFAEVYRVYHKFLGRQAMKVFKNTDITLNEIEKILGEAILLSQIGHPNVIRVFDANTFESPRGVCGYFTMENVTGGSLDKFWKSHGFHLVPIETTIDIIKQVCRGISVAHQSTPPIIHRDIKPQNILVGYEADGLRARVGDFGLAKEVNPLTLLATSAGTPDFKPPETFSKKRSDSCSADVWGIGVTLYLLLTDHLPYNIDLALGWPNSQIFDKDIVLPSVFNINLGKNLEVILMKCLELNPENRYKTAKHLLDALETCENPVKNIKPHKIKTKLPQQSKTVLGICAQHDADGKQMATKALKLAKNHGKLPEAADLMEEAFNKLPNLRQEYAKHVKLWRSGISM